MSVLEGFSMNAAQMRVDETLTSSSPPEASSEDRVNGCELTILMPCLNEARTLAPCIGKAKKFFDKTGLKGEVIVTDNGSTDGSQAIAEREGARVVPIQER